MRFVEPPWDAPLDAERVITQVSESSTIAGMFFLALIDGAERRQVTLEMPRSRYLPFGFYPVKESAPLFVKAAGLFHPERSLGAAGPVAFWARRWGA